MLDSCWIHAGQMLGSVDCFLVPELSILTHVGLMLDSCWTHVGLALDCVLTLFLVQFLVQLFNIMLYSCWTPSTPAHGFLYKNYAMEANNPFRTLTFSKAKRPGPQAQSNFSGQPREAQRESASKKHCTGGPVA